MALLEDVVQAVANENFKVTASAVSAGMAQAGQLAMLNATSHQQELNMLSKAALSEAILQRVGFDPAEAVATKKIAEADLAARIVELEASIASLPTILQQMIKTAQTTPPPTS